MYICVYVLLNYFLIWRFLCLSSRLRSINSSDIKVNFARRLLLKYEDGSAIIST